MVTDKSNSRQTRDELKDVRERLVALDSAACVRDESKWATGCSPLSAKLADCCTDLQTSLGRKRSERARDVRCSRPENESGNERTGAEEQMKRRTRKEGTANGGAPSTHL